MDEYKRYACSLSERMGYYKNCLTVRPGSSAVFVGVDAADRYATLEALVSPGQARIIAENLITYADQVDAEIARDAAFEKDCALPPKHPDRADTQP